MLRYSLQKILSLIPVLAGISLIAFLLGVVSPGDPAEIALSRGGMSEATREQVSAMRREMGLDLPLPVQYARWLGNALKGDLGKSFSTGEPVGQALARRLPVTLRLAAYAMLLTCFFGILFGILSAAYKDRTVDLCIRGAASVILSLPGFWLAILMILIFAENLRWLPTSGVGGAKSMLMPAVTLSVATMATAARLTRSALLTEMGKQYCLAANARGIGKYRLVVRNALPNAIVPVVTLLGNYFGGILGGSVIAETIFALPGIGSYAVQAIYMRDYPALQGYVLITGLIYVIITLVIDILSLVLNPKIRLGGGA